MAPDLSPESVTAALTTKALGRTLHLLDHCDSTNSVATRLAQEGAAHGTVVCAEHQTAGRGRRGRLWYDQPGASLCCSLLLRPAAPESAEASWVSWIPLAAAVGVATGVHDAIQVTISLKWPNDLLLHNKKVGGLLCERIGAVGTTPLFVIGIGLNANGSPSTFPAEFRNQATSLQATTGQPIARGPLLAHLLNALEPRLQAVLSHDLHRLRQDYERACATLNKLVRIDLPAGQRIEGTAIGLADSGALLVRPAVAPGSAPAPEVVEVLAGDVVHLREPVVG